MVPGETPRSVPTGAAPAEWGLRRAESLLSERVTELALFVVQVLRSWPGEPAVRCRPDEGAPAS